MSKEKVYCIYKHTSPSGKSYIGQTCNYKKRNNAHRNRTTGCSYFIQAIKKYGWDNFKHEILLDGLTLEDANYWEEFCIKEFNTLAPNGYNLQTGGTNNTVSNITRDKMAKSAINRPPISEETRNKIRNNSTGRTHSDETRLKISTSKLKNPISEESRYLIGSGTRGKIKNPELVLKTTCSNFLIYTNRMLLDWSRIVEHFYSTEVISIIDINKTIGLHYDTLMYRFSKFNLVYKSNNRNVIHTETANKCMMQIKIDMTDLSPLDFYNKYNNEEQV